eukprot:scaffold54933_cov99-Phaeocystis_antarctica.AAC.1
MDTFGEVACTERSRAGGSHCATPTEKYTQEGFFPRSDKFWEILGKSLNAWDLLPACIKGLFETRKHHARRKGQVAQETPNSGDGVGGPAPTGGPYLTPPRVSCKGRSS